VSYLYSFHSSSWLPALMPPILITCKTRLLLLHLPASSIRPQLPRQTPLLPPRPTLQLLPRPTLPGQLLPRPTLPGERLLLPRPCRLLLRQYLLQLPPG